MFKIIIKCLPIIFIGCGDSLEIENDTSDTSIDEKALEENLDSNTNSGFNVDKTKTLIYTIVDLNKEDIEFYKNSHIYPSNDLQKDD